METSIFDIPLLKEEITQYLLLRDLARCVLVSKEWNAWFTPNMWRTIDFTRKYNNNALARNQDHVRSIASIQLYFDKMPEGLICPNLRSLELTPLTFNYKHDEGKTLRLASHAPSLQSLVMRSIRDADSFFLEELFDTLKRLPMLTKLELHFSHLVKPGSIQRIIENCRHLKSFHLSCESNTPSMIPALPYVQVHEPEHQLETVKDGLDRLKCVQIQELSIRVASTEQESAILIPLLEKCHLLERLDLLRIHSTATMQQVSRVLATESRPRLKHLRIGSSSVESDTTAELLRVVGYEGEGECTESKDQGGLQTLIISHYSCFYQSIFKALPQYHSNTLTELDFCHRTITAKDLNYFLSGLPKLQAFRAKIPLEFKKDDEAPFGKIFSSSSPWACLGMRKLNLEVEVSGNVSRNYGSGWTDSPESQLMQYIFWHIGTLTALEEFRFTSRMNLLTTDGYLWLLGGLKGLRTLSLQTYHGRVTPSTSDIKWMLEHWPRLEYFQLDAGFIPGWSPRSKKKLPRNLVIKELQTGRPWLQITIGHRLL
ncbi:hypothetical protein BGX27_010931 [Mortierella sp. AM989]|nr:hypothetical protein BGX27_010931 [Mortierella sp. AM989]